MASSHLRKHGSIEAIRLAGTILLQAWHAFNFVSIGKIPRRVKGLHVVWVRCDSVAGSRQLTRQLLAGKHRHIAIISGPAAAGTSEGPFHSQPPGDHLPSANLGVRF